MAKCGSGGMSHRSDSVQGDSIGALQDREFLVGFIQGVLTVAQKLSVWLLVRDLTGVSPRQSDYEQIIEHLVQKRKLGANLNLYSS